MLAGVTACIAAAGATKHGKDRSCQRRGKLPFGNRFLIGRTRPHQGGDEGTILGGRQARNVSPSDPQVLEYRPISILLAFAVLYSQRQIRLPVAAAVESM
jgi:hypothetical protein